eukprot:364198-Chlamydomonas_euryale.AAC.4
MRRGEDSCGESRLKGPSGRAPLGGAFCWGAPGGAQGRDLSRGKCGCAAWFMQSRWSPVAAARACVLVAVRIHYEIKYCIHNPLLNLVLNGFSMCTRPRGHGSSSARYKCCSCCAVRVGILLRGASRAPGSLLCRAGVMMPADPRSETTASLTHALSSLRGVTHSAAGAACGHGPACGSHGYSVIEMVSRRQPPSSAPASSAAAAAAAAVAAGIGASAAATAGTGASAAAAVITCASAAAAAGTGASAAAAVGTGASAADTDMGMETAAAATAAAGTCTSTAAAAAEARPVKSLHRPQHSLHEPSWHQPSWHQPVEPSPQRLEGSTHLQLERSAHLQLQDSAHLRVEAPAHLQFEGSGDDISRYLGLEMAPPLPSPPSPRLLLELPAVLPATAGGAVQQGPGGGRGGEHGSVDTSRHWLALAARSSAALR